MNVNLTTLAKLPNAEIIKTTNNKEIFSKDSQFPLEAAQRQIGTTKNSELSSKIYFNNLWEQTTNFSSNFEKKTTIFDDIVRKVTIVPVTPIQLMTERRLHQKTKSFKAISLNCTLPNKIYCEYGCLDKIR